MAINVTTVDLVNGSVHLPLYDFLSQTLGHLYSEAPVCKLEFRGDYMLGSTGFPVQFYRTVPFGVHFHETEHAEFVYTTFLEVKRIVDNRETAWLAAILHEQLEKDWSEALKTEIRAWFANNYPETWTYSDGNYDKPPVQILKYTDVK